jgi:hypothetical protein
MSMPLRMKECVCVVQRVHAVLVCLIPCQCDRLVGVHHLFQQDGRQLHAARSARWRKGTVLSNLTGVILCTWEALLPLQVCAGHSSSMDAASHQSPLTLTASPPLWLLERFQDGHEYMNVLQERGPPWRPALSGRQHPNKAATP